MKDVWQGSNECVGFPFGVRLHQESDLSPCYPRCISLDMWIADNLVLIRHEIKGKLGLRRKVLWSNGLKVSKSKVLNIMQALHIWKQGEWVEKYSKLPSPSKILKLCKVLPSWDRFYSKIGLLPLAALSSLCPSILLSRPGVGQCGLA